MAQEVAESAVVAFARLPRPGQVKTRLAAGVGAEAAAEFYRRCAQTVLGELGRLEGVAKYVFFTQPEDEAEMAAWLAPLGLGDFVLQPQMQHADLGARMAHALRHALAEGHRRVAIVGTDVPDLTAEVMLQALQTLDSHQAVFGPAEDGGYYLLALTRLPQALFEGIEWSTSTVLSTSIDNAQREGLIVAPLGALPQLLDIDTVADLQRWVGSQQQQQQQQQQHQQQQRQTHRSLLQQAAQRIVRQQATHG